MKDNTLYLCALIAFVLFLALASCSVHKKSYVPHKHKAPLYGRVSANNNDHHNTCINYHKNK
jgi:hypothetical protein